MRVARFAEAATTAFRVLVVVCPVAGRPPTHWEPDGGEVVELDLSSGPPSSTLTALIADPDWRALLSATQPLPGPARLASPALAGRVADLVRSRPSFAVGAVPIHVVRSYLAPLGWASAHALAAPWTTLDLDDDDEAVAAAGGQTDEADAYARLVGTFAPLFDRVAVASSVDADRLRVRHAIDPLVVPNAVSVTETGRALRRPPDLLLVGNLDYRPNSLAAERLATRVLPRVRELTGVAVTVSIVGPHSQDNPVGRLGDRPGVEVTGFVPDLSGLYARAAAAVAPIPYGGGTRIKVLEALAHSVPVVTTTAGASGLDVTDGVELLIGDDDHAIAGKAAKLIEDPDLAGRLVRQGLDYLERHGPDRAAAATLDFLGLPTG